VCCSRCWDSGLYGKQKTTRTEQQQDDTRRSADFENEFTRQQAEEDRKRAEEEQRRRYYDEHSQEQAQRNRHHRDERHYGKVLGLQGQITREDVRRRYRELVSQYHPDKVNHLGAKLRALAEQEMKEINEAYTYFKDKYGMT